MRWLFLEPDYTPLYIWKFYLLPELNNLKLQLNDHHFNSEHIFLNEGDGGKPRGLSPAPPHWLHMQMRKPSVKKTLRECWAFLQFYCETQRALEPGGLNYISSGNEAIQKAAGSKHDFRRGQKPRSHSRWAAVTGWQLLKEWT